MLQQYYQQNLDNAFEAAVGGHGADPTRFQHWLDTLSLVVPDIIAKPQREAAPVFSLPSRTDDLVEIESIAAHIAGSFSTLVVAGMGGSSLSGETLTQLRKPGSIELHFLDNIDPHTMDALAQTLVWRETVFLFISKSGNTIETLAQLAIMLRLAKENGCNIAKQFFVITIPNGNGLHGLAQAHGMRVVAHDVDLGGRFSVFSSVGLIPAAAAGVNIRALRAGAHAVMSELQSSDAIDTPAAQGAALHMALFEKHIRINVMMHYCDRLGGLANWYRQCWAESLGKCSTVSTPVRSRGATEQHSQLQLYLQGPKDKLFSLMMPQHAGQGGSIDFGAGADPRFDFLKGKTLGDLMAAQQRATLSSLVKHGSPVRTLTMREVNEGVLGALLMHSALEVILTANLLGVNAFDQPAVEDGKIFALQYLADASEENKINVQL